jgi:hypothetical protein
MSTRNDIQNKKVDFKVREDANIIISNDEDHGIINAVIYEPESGNSNALYVGNTPIASGYGFDNIATKQAVEELISNPKLQDLLKNTIDDGTEEEPVEEGTYKESFVDVNNIMIGINSEGELVAESFIDVYNIEITLDKLDESNHNIILRESNVYEFSTLEDINIIRIDFDYNIKSSSLITYKLNFTLDGPSKDMSLISTSDETNAKTAGSLELNGDGKNHHYILDTLSIPFIKNSNKLINEFPINIIFTNAENQGLQNPKYLFKNICKVKIIYPIFISSANTFNRSFSNALYDNLHGTELTVTQITGENDHYDYVYVPHILSENGFSIIFKKSNIACDFLLDQSLIRVNTEYYYDKYKSLYPYTGDTTWIIK